MIITLGSVVLAGYNNDAFVDQFSFASTVTSIVLSVVAIWMSISGEQNTNEIKNNIMGTAERLARTTDKIELVNTNIDLKMNEQLASLTDLNNGLQSIFSNITSIKDEMLVTNEKINCFLTTDKELPEIDFTDDQIVNYYNNIRPENGNKEKYDRVIEYVINIQENERSPDADEFTDAIGEFDNTMERLIYCGVLNCLYQINFKGKADLQRRIYEITRKTKS
jgi:hypothetical protein